MIAKLKSSFLNDSDGLSLNETIALWVMFIWAIGMLVVLISALILQIKGLEMPNFWIDYINVLSDVPVAVVIGLFGEAGFNRIGQGISGLRQSRSSMDVDSESNESTSINNGV